MKNYAKTHHVQLLQFCFFKAKVTNIDEEAQSQSLETHRQSEAFIELQVKSSSTALEETLTHKRMQMFFN